MYYSVSFRLAYTDTQAEDQTHKTHTWRAQKKPASCSEEVSWTFKKVGKKSPISLQPRAKSNTFYSAHTSWEKFNTVRVFMCTTYVFNLDLTLSSFFEFSGWFMKVNISHNLFQIHFDRDRQFLYITRAMLADSWAVSTYLVNQWCPVKEKETV